MSQLGQKSIVYHGDYCLGEVEIVTTSDQTFRFPNNEIRINHISQPSERCPPLSILQTISPFRVRCKLNPIPTSKHPYLITLYDSCLNELKTAVVIIGGEELHMVAMPSKQDKMPCFWCCSVPIGLYGSCLGMLNLRCLSIVFDLDETLIVANTMKSFEDKIEFLQKRIECEDDPLRVSGMSAELRRYVEDRALLKQYVENDNVVDNSGKLLRVQFEEVLQLSNEQERIVRPVIRLKERNTVLTRINPEIRDTSVLVRLRPAWEDLRSYLNAKGRKRFEVYVCTMAERDYALEMWRLLDPEAHLITSNQLLNRIVCVKSGGKKSLPSVFREGICHPKLAMVIDDRLKVWEDDDQPRVHVVPPFTPYYSPQAETANIVPVLCVARNVACNVRAGFFKEFDENLLRRIFEMCYEDEVATLPYSPDVSDFLMSEDTGLVVNGNRDAPIPDGMNGAEVEQRLHRLDETPVVELATSFDTKVPDLRPEVAQQPMSISPNFINSETSKTNLPLQKSGLPESRPGVIPPDLDTDKKRRFIDMHHGQDIHEQSSREPSLSRPTTDIPSPAIQTRGGWLVEEDSDLDQTNNQTAGPAQELDESQDKQQAHQNLPCFRTESIRDIASELKKEEAHCRQEGSKLTRSLSNQSVHSEGEVSVNQENKEVVMEAGKIAVLPPYLYIGVLQEIGRRCGSKIEFRSVVSTSKDLQFSVEVLFTGEKIGVGMGKTKKDAQQQAAEKALHMLADEYKAYSGSLDRDLRPSLTNDNGFLWDDAEPDELREALPNAHASEAGGGALGGLTSFGIHETRKRANSPRSSESIQNKRLKGDLAPGLQVATLHKNENTVS